MEADLPLELIEQRYSGKWILVEETAWDEYGNPTRGVVIAHSPDRAALVKPTRNVHQQQPGIKTFAFYAGPKIPEELVVILCPNGAWGISACGARASEAAARRTEVLRPGPSRPFSRKVHVSFTPISCRNRSNHGILVDTGSNE